MTDTTPKTDITDAAPKTDVAVKPVKLAKEKTKQTSRGQRKHVRRMKQEARKEGVVYRPGIQ